MLKYASTGFVKIPWSQYSTICQISGKEAASTRHLVQVLHYYKEGQTDLFLGRILLNIYFDKKFYFLFLEARNLADETIPFPCDKNLDFVLTVLEEYSIVAINWFENSYMKMNMKQILTLMGQKVGDPRIWKSKRFKLLISS